VQPCPHPVPLLDTSVRWFGEPLLHRIEPDQAE
jgi:hypothetical protein